MPTTLPVLCFGGFGLIAPRPGRRVRERTLLIGAMALLVVGVITRSGPGATTLLGVVVLMLLPGLGAGCTRTICVPSDPGR